MIQTQKIVKQSINIKGIFSGSVVELRFNDKKNLSLDQNPIIFESPIELPPELYYLPVNNEVAFSVDRINGFDVYVRFLTEEKMDCVKVIAVNPVTFRGIPPELPPKAPIEKRKRKK